MPKETFPQYALKKDCFKKKNVVHKNKGVTMRAIFSHSAG